MGFVVQRGGYEVNHLALAGEKNFARRGAGTGAWGHDKLEAVV
jgi:hypothetical protein